MDSRSFEEWFRGWKVGDANGRPHLVHRGEHGLPNGEIFQIRLGSLSFGSVRAAKIYASHPNRYGETANSPRIIPAILSICRPVMDRPDDPFIELTEIGGIVGTDRAVQIAHELAAYIENTCNWMDNFSNGFDSVADLLRRQPSALHKLFVDAYPVFDSRTYVSWFRDAGFDGAIHAGSGETAEEVEYKVFSERQVMFAFSAGIPFRGDTPEKMDQA